MSLRSLLPVALAAGGVLALSACGVQAPAAGDGPTTAASTSGSSLPPFLDLVERAKDTTAFRGTRRVSSISEMQVMEVVEDVGADGTGAFAIELVEAVSLLPGTDPLSFPVTHENAARFQWQMRDFRIWSLQRASVNYLIDVLPDAPVVAGIPCERVEFQRISSPVGRPGHFEADIDPNTGFVLAWRELGDQGQPIIESTFETFAYGGDVSDMTLRDRTFSAQVLDLNAELSSQVGGDVFVPDVFPQGFELVGGELLTIPSLPSLGTSAIIQAGDWVRFLASDGIETVSFAHGVTQAVSTSALGDLRVVSLGLWEVGFGELAGVKFVVAGRTKADGLASIVQSAF